MYHFIIKCIYDLKIRILNKGRRYNQDLKRLKILYKISKNMNKVTIGLFNKSWDSNVR